MPSYQSKAAFSRAFKRFMGVSPGQRGGIGSRWFDEAGLAVSRFILDTPAMRSPHLPSTRLTSFRMK